MRPSTIPSISSAISSPGRRFGSSDQKRRRNGAARPIRHDYSPRVPVFWLERLNLTVQAPSSWHAAARAGPDDLKDQCDRPLRLRRRVPRTTAPCRSANPPGGHSPGAVDPAICWPREIESDCPRNPPACRGSTRLSMMPPSGRSRPASPNRLPDLPPLSRTSIPEWQRARASRSHQRRTEGSNPSSSSEESHANLCRWELRSCDLIRAGPALIGRHAFAVRSDGRRGSGARHCPNNRNGFGGATGCVFPASPRGPVCPRTAGALIAYRSTCSEMLRA
jgi:hypothetical protein